MPSEQLQWMELGSEATNAYLPQTFAPDVQTKGTTTPVKQVV